MTINDMREDVYGTSALSLQEYSATLHCLRPEWQARSCGYRLHSFQTLPEHRFKLTGPQLNHILREAPDIRVLYLTISNNPTTFSYTSEELHALHAVLRRYRQEGHTMYMITDLAYIGTGSPQMIVRV